MDRPWTVTALALALCVPLAGCGRVRDLYLPTAQDIADVELVRVMALDRGEDGAVLVTVSSGVSGSTEGEEPKPPVVLQEEGQTVFSACLAIQTQGDSCVNYSSVDQCLVSEEETAEGLAGLMDFLERDYEMRMDTQLFLAQGDPAGAFLRQTATETSSASDRLQSIGRDYPLESQGWTVTVRQALIDLTDNGCALLPVVVLRTEEDQTTIESQGVAWVADDQVGGHFTEEEARAAAILSNNAVGGAVEVTLGDGTLAGLRLTELRCKWLPQWEGNELTGVKGVVTAKADIAELQGPADPADEAVTEELDRLLQETLEEQLKDVMDTAQETGADLFHLRRTLLVRSPRRSGALETHWEDWYPTLDITLSVESDVERSYAVSRGSEAAQ